MNIPDEAKFDINTSIGILGGLVSILTDCPPPFEPNGLLILEFAEAFTADDTIRQRKAFKHVLLFLAEKL